MWQPNKKFFFLFAFGKIFVVLSSWFLSGLKWGGEQGELTHKGKIRWEIKKGRPFCAKISPTKNLREEKKRAEVAK